MRLLFCRREGFQVGKDGGGVFAVQAVLRHWRGGGLAARVFAGREESDGLLVGKAGDAGQRRRVLGPVGIGLHRFEDGASTLKRLISDGFALFVVRRVAVTGQ